MTLCFLFPITRRLFSKIFIRKKGQEFSTIKYIKYIKLSYLSLKHIKVNLFLSQDFETGSSYLLSKTIGSALAIRNFLQMYKSHFRDPKR